MLRYLYADELNQYPQLRDSMFRDRAEQFHTRLGWAVTVDAQGFERDEYDALNPLYVLWQKPGGLHGGSMRFLPTTGRTMVNDHFLHLTNGVEIRSPLIWECTRFCLSRGVDARVAGALMMGAGEILRGFGLTHLLGVFDARMVRIYKAIGASPEVLGSMGEGRERISVGLWDYEGADEAKVLARSGLSRPISRMWFESAFGETIPARRIRAA